MRTSLVISRLRVIGKDVLILFWGERKVRINKDTTASSTSGYLCLANKPAFQVIAELIMKCSMLCVLLHGVHSSTINTMYHAIYMQ